MQCAQYPWHATTSTSCLHRKFHNMLLQNPSCISNDGLDIFPSSHKSLLASSDLAQYLTLSRSLKLRYPCICQTFGLMDQMPRTIPEAGFQLLVSPWLSKPLIQEKNLSLPTSYTHTSVWTHHCSISRWVLNSSELLLILEPAETFPVIFVDSLLLILCRFLFFSISIFNYSSYNTEGSVVVSQDLVVPQPVWASITYLLVGRCNQPQ